MRDNNYVTIGRWLYVINLICLGLLHFTGQMIQNFTLAAWMPLKTPIAYLTGLALVAAGVLIAIKKYALWGTYLAATVFAIFLVFLLIPQLIINLSNPGGYTFMSETFMFFSGALMLCGHIFIEKGDTRKGSKVFIVGKYIFALTLFDFGMEHWLSEPYVVSIIPTWIPDKTFWAYFVMCAFFAASISLFINKWVKPAMLALFLMFLLWAILLHLPQVTSAPGNSVFWSYLSVPIGVCGIALIVAGSTGIKLPGGLKR